MCLYTKYITNPKYLPIKILKSSMVETSTTPKIPSKGIEDYVKNTITEGLKSGGKIINYPGGIVTGKQIGRAHV